MYFTMQLVNKCSTLFNILDLLQVGSFPRSCHIYVFMMIDFIDGVAITIWQSIATLNIGIYDVFHQAVNFQVYH